MNRFVFTAANDGRDGPGSADVRLTGHAPEVAGLQALLEGDRIVWSGDSVRHGPAAGTGVASTLLDLVLGADQSAPAATRERSIPVDQTHTSVIVDGTWVVKIVAQWGAADRSTTMLHRLNDEGFRSIPEFLGSVIWEHPERGETTLALVSAYVPDSSDGWTWAVNDVLAHLDGGEPEPDWPGRLGEITAQMHRALITPAVECDPRRGDRERAIGAIDRATSLLRDGDDTSVRVGSRLEAMRADIETIPTDSATPLVLPHGDFHVGQVLRTPDGDYLVLDFDGDPQWSHEQRFRPDGAVRDVAHMLTSIDLVGAVAQRRLGGPDERAWRWAADAKQAFLASYRAQAGSSLLDERALDGLIAERLLLELSYAEDYLPVWRYAPDGVITRRYLRSTNEMEPTWNPPALPTT